MDQKTGFRRRLRALAFGLDMAGVSAAGAGGQGPDPFAANNGLYPVAADGTLLWKKPLRLPNFDYPDQAPPNPFLKTVPRAPLTVATAREYTEKLKAFVAPSLRDMIEKPDAWSPRQAGWYDMPWQAQGDAASGREAILGAFAGQVLQPGTFQGLAEPLQNHTVIYYDVRSAAMLRRLWANPFNPDRAAVRFPEGSMVVKAGAVTPTPAQWPVLDGAATWTVWRPAVADLAKHAAAQRADPEADAAPPAPRLVELRVMQFDVIIKDSIASPRTGWVFTTFVYNKDAPGRGPWDRLVPLGAQWGNDPVAADRFLERRQAGLPPLPLRENWINREGSAPFALEQLGWQGRLSGPIDVSRRHGVIYASGGSQATDQRASSCMSCHGTAQYPFAANLYPSPNRGFPADGSTFLLYEPGSPEWNRWFRDRGGRQPMTPGAVALDYDPLIMFALGAFDAAAGNDRYTQKNRPRVH